ncbi:MAG TPA: ribosome maturation factor RimP [Polyangiaceae bacterium]|jgi:ribosome maturation factor RimP
MTGLQSSPLHGIDRDALVRVVEPVVRAHGAELVDLELKPDQNGWVLRVFVEKAGASANNMSTRDAAVNLELCANVSHDLSPALDVVDLIPHAYSLEVSSPGVERPLRGERDFVRFTGQKAKLRMRNPVAGQRVLVGTLDGVAGGVVRVKEGSRVHEAPLDSIDSARLVFEFGSSSDGKNKKKHRG